MFIMIHLANIGYSQVASPESIDLTRAIQMAIAQNRALALSALGTASNALNIAKAESAFQIDVRPDLYLDYAGERTIIGTGLLASKKWASGTRASVEGIAVNASGDGNAVSQKILRVEIAQPLPAVSVRWYNGRP